MSVSVETPATPTKPAIPPTLRTRLDDALADAAGLEVELEESQATIVKLEEQLQSQSSGVEYASEYAAHNKKRNAEMGKLRRRLERRDERIAKLDADISKRDDRLSEQTEEIRDLNLRIVNLAKIADNLIASKEKASREASENADKVAVQAQEIIQLRHERDVHCEANTDIGEQLTAANGEIGRLLEQVDALEQILESQYGAMMETINARGDIINALDLANEELRTENAKLSATTYLKKRPSYVRGVLSAVAAVGYLVVKRGGVK